MASVRARAAPFDLGRDFSPPGLFAHLFRSQEIAVLDRFVSRPKTARAAKVRDPRFRTDSSAREYDHPPALIDQSRQLLNCVRLKHSYDSSVPFADNHQCSNSLALSQTQSWKCRVRNSLANFSSACSIFRVPNPRSELRTPCSELRIPST